MPSVSKRIRICGHFVEISQNKSNMSCIIFNTRTYYEHIASFLSYKDNIPLKQLSNSQNKMYSKVSYTVRTVSESVKKKNLKVSSHTINEPTIGEPKKLTGQLTYLCFFELNLFSSNFCFFLRKPLLGTSNRGY